MKSTLLIAALSLCLTAPLWAQSDDSSDASSTPPADHHHWGGGPQLTKDEWTELKTAHDTALQQNPDLAAEEKALHDQQKAFMQKMHDAMIKADANVAPILTKLEAGHHHHGPPPGDDAGTPNP
jgi:Spy/CpxP family protein refolding chaperone